MFEELSTRLESVINKFRGQSKITEENISEAMREVKRALLEADVNFKVVKEFTKAVQEKALGEEVISSVTPGQFFIKIVHDELAKLMGGAQRKVEFEINRTNVILMADR